MLKNFTTVVKLFLLANAVVATIKIIIISVETHLDIDINISI